MLREKPIRLITSDPVMSRHKTVPKEKIVHYPKEVFEGLTPSDIEMAESNETDKPTSSIYHWYLDNHK